MEPARYETTEDVIHDLFGSDLSFSDESMSDENELEDASTSNIRSNAPNNPLSTYDHHSSFDSQLNASENGNNNLENESEHGPISGPMVYKYALMTCDKSRKYITHKTSKKVRCPARLNAIKQDDGSWIVSKVVSEHNHEIDPSYSILMPAHRRIPVHMRRQLEANNIASIRPCKNVRLCEVQSSGPMNLGCSPKDCRNFIDHRRRLRLGEGDTEAIHRMFARIQQKDRDFFHLIDIDDQGGYPHVTNEYKKFQEFERYFQECADVAMDDVSKMEFIKRKCIEMKSELLNWNPEMEANMSVPMDTTSVDVGGIPVLDPRIMNSRERLGNNRYLSSRETNTRGRGTTSSRGRGGGASSSTRGRPRGSGVPRSGRGRGGRRVSSTVGESSLQNNESYVFTEDLNDPIMETQESLAF
ncbi:hypothetical protein ACS0TY_017966 [Phlomoides rotata]